MSVRIAAIAILLLLSLVAGCQVIAEPVPEPTTSATLPVTPNATLPPAGTPQPRCDVRRQQSVANVPAGYQFMEFDIGGAQPDATITLSVNDQVVYRCRPLARDEVTGAGDFFAVLAPAGATNLVLLSDTGVEPWTMSVVLAAPRYFIVNLTSDNEWRVSILDEPPEYE